MALQSLTDLKNFFKTNFIPTQQQFWDMLDSFRHKSDKVSATDIDGLTTLLAAKASNEAFNSHTSAENAHAGLFGALRTWVSGQIAGITVGSTPLGSITPSTTIPATINVHGFAAASGTYGNCGGMIVPANSIAFLARVGGFWTVSATTFDVSGKVNVSDVINNLNSTSIVNPLSANQGTVLDKKLVNKADLIDGKNLFNPLDADVLRGSVIAITGTIWGGSASTTVTGFMKVSPGQTIVCNKTKTTEYHNFYDINKVRISSLIGSAALVAPVGAAYLRMTLSITSTEDIIAANCQVEAGTVSTSYEPFGGKVSLTQIPSTIPTKVEVTSIVENYNYSAKKVGKNLLNESAQIIGMLNADGTINTASTNNRTSQLIPILSSQDICHNGFGQSSNIVEYDVNGVFIKNTSMSFLNYITTTSTTKFIRYGWWISVVNNQIEYGRILTQFKPYGLVVDEVLGKTSLASIAGMANKVSLPSLLIEFVEHKSAIYFKPIMKRWIEGLFFVRFDNYGFSSYKNRAISKYTTAGTRTVSVSLYNADFDKIEGVTSSLVVIAKNTATTGCLNQIGDSYIAPGLILKRISDLLPAITFCGALEGHSGLARPDIVSQGVSGWKLNDHFTRVKATSGLHSFLLHPQDPYKYYGDTATWKSAYDVGVNSEKYDTAVRSGISNTTYRPTTPAVNDLIYDGLATLKFFKWDGVAWVEVLESSLTFTVNYAKYISVYQLNAPNIVTILTGINDFASVDFESFSAGTRQTTLNTFKTQMDSLIASIKSYSSTIPIGVCLSTSAFSSDDTTEFVAWKNANMYQLREFVIANYDNRSAEKIFVVDVASSLDPDFAWSVKAESPFPEYTASAVVGSIATEIRRMTTDAIHPDHGGYDQIGTRLAAFVQYARSL